MSNIISQIRIGGTTYALKDADARLGLATPATSAASGVMSSADKVKLDGIDVGANAYTHPSYTSAASGFYKFAIDELGHVSSKTNVELSDLTNLGVATSTVAVANGADGLMSGGDKGKLDGIESGANAYSHPTNTAYSEGFYKLTIDGLGHVTSATGVTLTDLTGLGAATSAVVTSVTNGLMSSSDKVTLDSLKTSYDNLVFEAPEAYDTLKEIGTYISEHASVTSALEILAGMQSDWTEADSTNKAYIKNKPTTMANPQSLKIRLSNVDKITYTGSTSAVFNIAAGNGITITESSGTFTFATSVPTFASATHTISLN
jgi:hypothetical protein